MCASPILYIICGLWKKSYTTSMGRRRTRFTQTVTSAIRRRYLDCFIDPAEVRLLTILGGAVLTIGKLKRDGRPFSLVLSQGKLLRSEKFKRIALDNQTVLYMNDINNAIMIQMEDQRLDIVKEQELADRLIEADIRVRYIPQRWLESNPVQALKSVQQFIYA